MKAVLALLCCAAVAGPACAEIYQWTDDKGRTHFGEIVPEKYQKAATQKDTGKVNLMQAQKAPPQPPSTPAPAPAAAAGANPADSSGGLPATPEQRCQQEMQRYEESQVCFARFRNANGSVRPEAFQECPQLPTPACAGQR